MTDRSHQEPSSRAQGSTERGHAEYVEGESLVDMIHDDLITSRISIDGCRGIIQHLRDQDAPTCHSLEGILSVKGQRASDATNRAARIIAALRKKNGRVRSP